MAEKLTRRDWFRLKKPQRVAEALGNESSDSCSLRSIADPTNHGAMDLSQLPPMVEAVLSSGQLELLFSDIGELGENVVLMQKTQGSLQMTRNNAETRNKLTLAKDALMSGTIQRVQIRYHWQSAYWIDTLEKKESGFRLVRIAHD